jgi:PPK2 family polyphosphate:nucleotide phosphotransferase
MGAPERPLSDKLRVPGGEDLLIAGLDPAATFVDEDDAADELDDLRSELFDRHELMMANEEHAVLLVLQGLDCSGKNGTIKHVVAAMNPSAVRIVSFRERTKEEEAEHFLERIRREVPEPGTLTVFDRSHYEDTFVPAVHDGMDGDEFDQRLEEICEFEAELADRNVHVVKCFLHISFDEQRRRFLRRLRRHDKRWKFSESDLDTRARWPEWEVVYGKAIGRTSTEVAPWYAIPADRKWHRNWAIATILAEQFRRLGEEYPEPFSDAELERLRARLEPPN